ncbi:MAG: response regulator receiver modulated CheB methylesterase [Chlamydiales bacterium]|jgi:two-component system chemotaxis response regulator CheB|nr:response regulator receiver modulated CheB methylesterase [Chlamydiales bacterium]
MRVLIADDSAVMRMILSQVIQQQEGLELVGEAKNGQEAYDFNVRYRPDLIIMDINMPVLGGLEATQKIMNHQPVPILIFSNAVDSHTSFIAIKNGAVDIIKKPNIDQLNNPDFIKSFCEKLLSLRSFKSLSSTKNLAPTSPSLYQESKQAHYEMLVIGASTGGPVAVNTLLSGLPKDFPLPIAIVQHLEVGFDQGYVEWLDSDTKLNVRLAKDGDSPQPGEVLVAPATHHIVFQGRRLYLNDGPRVLNQKPAVDVLFETAAKTYKQHLVGVLLTGMGADGANGCVAIKQQSGYTVVQDKESSAIFGMPKCAIEKGGACTVLPLLEISKHLIKITSNKS